MKMRVIKSEQQQPVETGNWQTGISISCVLGEAKKAAKITLLHSTRLFVNVTLYLFYFTVFAVESVDVMGRGEGFQGCVAK